MARDWAHGRVAGEVDVTAAVAATNPSRNGGWVGLARVVVMLLLALALPTGCGGESGEDGGEEAKAEKTTEKKKKKKKVAPPVEEAEPDTFGWHMRKLGKLVEERTQSCKKLALSRMSGPAALKALPIVPLREFKEACDFVAARYNLYKEEHTGRHFTSDGVLEKLARFKDAYDVAIAEIEAKRPGETLSRAISELKNLAERLDRNAGSLGQFKVNTKPRDVHEEKKVKGGRIRAVVEEIGRNDRSDIGGLYSKWEGLAYDRARKNEPIYTNTLEHFIRVRIKWQNNHRAHLKSLRSENEGYDKRLRAGAEEYFRAADAVVNAFKEASVPYIEGNIPSSGEARELKRALERAQKEWEKVNEGLNKKLAEII